MCAASSGLTGALSDTSDPNPRAINNDQPAFAFAVDFGSTAASTSFVLGHVRTPLISYGQSATQLLPLWTNYLVNLAGDDRRIHLWSRVRAPARDDARRADRDGRDHVRGVGLCRRVRARAAPVLRRHRARHRAKRRSLAAGQGDLFRWRHEHGRHLRSGVSRLALARPRPDPAGDGADPRLVRVTGLAGCFGLDRVTSAVLLRARPGRLPGGRGTSARQWRADADRGVGRHADHGRRLREHGRSFDRIAVSQPVAAAVGSVGRLSDDPGADPEHTAMYR